LILHTAGTRGAAVPLPGLPYEAAEAMRDRIRAKIRQELA
jgi:membrane protein YdbS with pleckstrin-like domain